MRARADRLASLARRELETAAAAEVDDDFPAAWLALERAHVAAQSLAVIHIRVHVQMIRLAWRQRDLLELLGQVAVIPLAPIGSVTGLYRIAGGRFHRSAFAASGIPADIMTELRGRP